MTTHDEQNSEAIILEKLERMESFAKSLIASLEEPPEKKGRIRITADIPYNEGKITKWYGGGYDREVSRDEPLCEIEWGDPFVFGGATTIRAPVKGYLRILVGAGKEVDQGQLIAVLDEIIKV